MRNLLIFLFLFSQNGYSQNIPVKTHIPSSVADSTGITVYIHYPDSARYDTCGAPVAIVIAGGKGAIGIIPAYPAVLTPLGFIQVFFNFPGGGSGPFLSGGTYDLRGPKCIAALKDVIRFCSGEIPNVTGQYLNQLIPIEPNYQNVGLIGGSNGGNMSLATAGVYGNELHSLKWIVNWESPVGDQIQLADMGNVNAGGTTMTHNMAYNDTTGNFDYSKLKYSSTLYLNYSMNFDTLAGFYFDNNNNGVPGDSIDFPLAPLLYGTGTDERAFYSLKIIQLGYSLGIIPNPKPFYIPTATEAADFWRWRNGCNWIDSAIIKKPDLLFMITSKNHDHYLNSPDHPGVLFQYQKIIDAGINFIRLNPDKSYLQYVLDSVYPGLPDNTCFAAFDHLSIRNAMVPDSIDEKLLYAAGACELADRSIRGDFRWQLDTVYGNCEKYVAAYSDSAETDHSGLNDSPEISVSTINYSAVQIRSTLFPNPGSTTSNLLIHSIKNEMVKINIADVAGKIIYSSNENLVRGENSVQLKINGLDNGFYFLSIQNNARVETLKLEVLH